MKYLDGGFGLSFGLGSGLSFLCVFVLCGTGIFAFDSIISFACLILFGVTVWISVAISKKTTLCNLIKELEWSKFLVGFGLFAVLFLFAVLVKGYAPNITGATEQYMDFGIMQSIYRQKVLPPEDFWMCNQALNYYYLGLAACVYLGRLAFLSPDFGYNLMLCTMFAATSLMCFEIVSGFVLTSERVKTKLGQVISGVVGGLMAIFAGNGHYLLFGIIAPVLYKYFNIDIWYDENQKFYWFANSTAYIGVHPDMGDYGKHEFPAYTLVLGDLHAHLINMLWVLPLIAVILDYCLDDSKEEKSVVSKLFSPHVIIIGLILGLFRGTNFWDFPIYFVVAGACILFTDIKKEGANWNSVCMVLLKGVVILFLGYIVILPFTLNFDAMISGIYLTSHHSQLYKMVILWGIPFVFTIALLLLRLKSAAFNVNKMSLADLCIIAIGLCAIGLVLTPEVIFIKDIYGDAYERFNTMFKLTYQAFVLFGLLTGILVGELIALRQRAASGVVIGIVLLLSMYIITSGHNWLWNRNEEWKGLSALENSFNYDEKDRMIYDTIQVINEDERKDLHILEVVGADYKPDNRVSAFTGVPTVMGWPVHEWLWQNSYDPVGVRTEEVRRFYEDGDLIYNQEFLQRYGIDYIVVGPEECAKYYVDMGGIDPYTDAVFYTESGYRLMKVKE